MTTAQPALCGLPQKFRVAGLALSQSSIAERIAFIAAWLPGCLVCGTVSALACRHAEGSPSHP